MKRMIFFASIILMLVCVSCGNQNNSTPIAGNPTLYTFTTTAEDGKTILTGVAQPQSGKVIITPAAYQSITADDYIITCKEPSGTFAVFKTDGELIGRFEMITPWDVNGKYYLGVRYINKTFYFPLTNKIITSQNVHNEYKVMFINNGESWDVFDYEGKQLSNFAEGFVIIKNDKIPSQIWVAVETAGKYPACTLYKTTGEVYKKLTPRQWQKRSKFLKIEKVINDTVRVTTTENFNQL
ncbi:MAG: hypothetical protein NC218_06800 [Acetobacter sp.]|nr:hypothetical protein [Acetobacter sp.]